MLCYERGNMYGIVFRFRESELLTTPYSTNQHLDPLKKVLFINALEQV